MSTPKRYHSILCTDEHCEASCPHVPPIRYEQASGMFERLSSDGQWCTLDFIDEVPPER